MHRRIVVSAGGFIVDGYGVGTGDRRVPKPSRHPSQYGCLGALLPFFGMLLTLVDYGAFLQLSGAQY